MAKPKWEEWTKADGLILLEGWARDGLTDEQIAHNMGINVSTLYVYKKEHKEIAEALKKSKDIVDKMVENALLKRALGYSYEEHRIEILPDGTKKASQTTRMVPPDTTAQIFWLKNRKPDVWRNKPVDNVEVIEDDGLMEALAQSVKALKDDSDFLPKAEE